MSKKILDYSFEDKWSEDIAVHNFTQVPNILLRCQGHLELNDGELMTLIHLTTFWFHGTQKVWPSITKLKSFSGKSYATVQKRLTKLEEKGFIKRRRRMGTSSTYDFRPAVKKLTEHSRLCIKKDTFRPLNTKKTVTVLPSFPTYKEDEAKKIFKLRNNSPKFSDDNTGTSPTLDRTTMTWKL